MPFLIQQYCPCCKDMLWHCEKCWNRFHNGRKDKDYILPKHYGQSMMDFEHMREELKKLDFTDEQLAKFQHNPKIKENKNQIYHEWDYGHKN